MGVEYDNPDEVVTRQISEVPSCIWKILLT